MLRPTIYIPSRLTKLLAPLALSQREVLPTLAGLLGPGAVADPVARTRAEPGRAVAGIGEPAAIDGKAAAAYALAQPQLEALELTIPCPWSCVCKRSSA